MNNRQQILLNKLYRVDSLGDALIDQSINASIWVNTGAVDIYGSDSFTEPTVIADMTLDNGDTGVTGKKRLDALPEYLVLVQNGATTPTEVILTGVLAVEIGDIA